MNVVSKEALMVVKSLSTTDELDIEPTKKLWTNSPPVKPPGMIEYLLKSLSVQKEHSSRNYMRYFANAGEKVRFYRT